MTLEEVRSALIACLPDGARVLYDIDNRGSDVSKYVDALASAVKTYGSDEVDELRLEFVASSASQLIPAWEAALGLAGSDVAVRGSTAQRQAQIAARLREFGASTLGNIQAALLPVLGYTPTIIEHTPAGIRPYILRSLGALPIVCAGFSTTSVTFDVDDNAYTSAAGVRLDISVTHANPADLSITLTGPATQFKTWTSANFGTAALSGKELILWAPNFAGFQAFGKYTLTITCAGADTGTLTASTAGALIDGIGTWDGSAEGYGARIFEWSAAINETLTGSTYSRQAACDVVGRWNPAHCLGGVALYQTDGTLGAVSDDTNCIADMTICGE